MEGYSNHSGRLRSSTTERAGGLKGKRAGAKHSCNKINAQHTTAKAHHSLQARVVVHQARALAVGHQQGVARQAAAALLHGLL